MDGVALEMRRAQGPDTVLMITQMRLLTLSTSSVPMNQPAKATSRHSGGGVGWFRMPAAFNASPVLALCLRRRSASPVRLH